MADLVGQTLGGCELLERIGQGGMGVIYRARQISLDRVVAVKVLARRLSGDERFVERFQREAKAIAKVNHPNILAVYDVGEAKEVHYMIMEIIDGGSAGELLEKKGVLDPWVGADIARGAALGLECAQRAGIIHRDIKPDNLMLTSEFVVKVSDFGLAKAIGGDLTQTETVMGTPAYMSPEQCDGLVLDGRCDIYALGGTFFRLITGRLPFEAETPMTMMYRHKHEPITPPHEIVPTIPPALSRIICRMMEKERDDRYQTMAEVVAAIDQVRAPAGGAIAEGLKTVRLSADVGAAAPVRERAEKLLAENKLTEGAREMRRALELDPDNKEMRERLRLIDTRIMRKRNEVNEVRMLISGGRLEEAVTRWERLPSENREETLGRQIERIRDVTLPAGHACDEAERAETEGDLEAAIAAYRRAIEIDEVNERARQGLQGAERKRNRATHLLQQGTERRMAQDFSAAADALEGAHRVHPQDTRIGRALVEVHLAAGHHAIQMNQLEGAIEAWRRALKVDPDNREATRFLDEHTRRLDRMKTLLREAMELSNAKQHGPAARAWRRYLAEAPKDRQAVGRLAAERRACSRQRLKRLTAVLVLLAAAAGAYEYWIERTSLDRAEGLLVEARRTGRFDTARAPLHEPPLGFLLLRARHESVLRTIEQLSGLAEAIAKEKAGDWGGSAAIYERLATLAASAADEADLRRAASRARYHDAVLRGARLELRDDWRANESAIKAVYGGAHGHAQANGGMENERRLMTGSVRFLECLAQGLAEVESHRPTRARGEFERAWEQLQALKDARVPEALRRPFGDLLRVREGRLRGAMRDLGMGELP